MDIQAALLTIAEVAITLAGFTGLVIAIAGNGRDTPQAFFRVAAIVAACFILVITALLPSGLVAADVSAGLSFGIASAFLGVGFLAVGISMAVAGSRGVFVSSTPRFSLALRIPSFVLAFFLILAPVFGWISSSSALLLFSCFWFLSLVGAYFILSILWVLQNQALGGEEQL